MDHTCTVYRTMDYLAKRWTVMILLELYKGSNMGTEWKRFSELKNGMKDITAKMLSERLKELIEQSLVENKIDNSSFPIKSEYRLTDSARELMHIIHDIKIWALKWNIDNKPCKNQDCRVCIL